MNRRSFFGRLFGALVILVTGVKNAFADAFAELPDFGAPSPKQEHRLEWNAFEAAWLAAWRLENAPTSWSGYGPFVAVLGRYPTKTEKDAVAAVIQWFGSNCGKNFIEEALKMQGFTVKWNGNDDPNYAALAGSRHEAVWSGKPHKRVRVSFRHHKVWV